jgi:ankyrin repeat protein
MDHENERLIFNAACRGNLNKIKYIVSQNMNNLDLQYKVNGFNALHIAAKKGFIDIISYMLEVSPVLIWSKTDDFRNSEMIAAFCGNLTVLKFLNACKCCEETKQEILEINDEKDSNGNSLLHFSTWGGSLECTKYIVENYKTAVVNCKNNEGMTPMQFASAGNHAEVISYLMSLDAMLLNDDVSISGLTCLHRSAIHGSLATMILLTSPSTKSNLLLHSSSIDVDVQSTDSKTTPLHLAVKHGHFAIVKHLVEVCYANVELVNEYGLNALHFACIGYLLLCINNFSLFAYI